MTQRPSSNILKLAALKPLQNEPDTLIRNYDGTLVSVKNAPLIRALAKGLGVTFNIVMQEDDEFGIKKHSGTWTGIMEMLIKGEADLSSIVLILGKGGTVTVNFTYLLHVTDATFMTEKTKAYPKSFAIFDAFSFEMWLGIGVCVILMSLLLYILLKRRETYYTILFETIGCLLENSFSFEARQRHTALLLFFWFLGITVLTNSYKAIILSVINIPKMAGIRDIKGLAEAAKENSTMCMSYQGGNLWQIEPNDDHLNSIEECIKRAEKESLNNHRAFSAMHIKKHVYHLEMT